ncbi:hypothetical protein MKX03_037441, partial [Papaver bracteatum]
MTGSGVGNKSEEPLLLQQNIISTDLNEESSREYIEGMVNYKGEKLLKMINNQVGGWKSAIPLIVIAGTDGFVFSGISSNLISYLTNNFGQSTATAALNVNIWVGAVLLLPLLISPVADSYTGRFRTVLFSTFSSVL